MSAIKVAAVATSRADPGKVFGLLKDPVTWPLWSMFVSGELQRPGRWRPPGRRRGQGVPHPDDLRHRGSRRTHSRSPVELRAAVRHAVPRLPRRRRSGAAAGWRHLDPLAVYVLREISGHRLVLADGHEPRAQAHRRKTCRRRRGSSHRRGGSSLRASAANRSCSGATNRGMMKPGVVPIATPRTPSPPRSPVRTR